MKVINEFAEIEVQKLSSKNGDRLLIKSLRSGHSTTLDASQLDLLCLIDSNDLEKLLKEIIEKAYD